MVDPTALALGLLIVWAPFTLLLFTQLRPVHATVFSILVAVMFLPARIKWDFPLVPPLSRENIAVMASLLGCLIYAPKRLRAVLPGTGVDGVMWVLLAGCFVTAMTNTDPIDFGKVRLPPETLYGAFTMGIELTLVLWAPFYLGRVLFRRPRDLEFLLLVMLAAALVYSVFILYEIRMSPQLHRIFYGYHQHQFAQTMRGDGWRPMVFMSHGLAVSLFLAAACAAGVSLWRSRVLILGVPTLPIAGYLFAVLVLCKSLASLLYAVVMLPLLAFARPRTQVRLAVAAAIVIFLYPLSRGMDVFPRRSIVSAAEVISWERAESLDDRFGYDEMLLERARDRMWFGWGGWNRNRKFDPVSGEDLTITDGYWIIVLGIRGVVGLVGTFGLLLFPVLVAARRWPRIARGRDQFVVAGLAWIVVITGVDLLPNAMLNPFLVLLAGALAGSLEALPSRRAIASARQAAAEPAPAAEPPKLGIRSPLLKRRHELR